MQGMRVFRVLSIGLRFGACSSHGAGECVMNNRQFLASSIGIVSLIVGILVVKLVWQEPSVVPPVTEHDLLGRNQRISGPYTHKNLTVFLVHGDDMLTGKAPLTLEEALERKLVIVHETSDVNELEIENVSKFDEVYVQAGDIVKGGKQDRVLAVDLIVPARSGRLALDAFCVEQGRWTQRRAESASEFSVSSDIAASKELKMAAKHSNSQSEVWSKVEEAQTKLNTSANVETRSSESRSSLQLSLENPRVRANADEYIDALSAIIDARSDAVGFVFAINGQINSADLYGSRALFKKLWPRLLKASAIEAVSESYRHGASNPVTTDDLQTFFADAETSPVVLTRPVTDRITMITRKSKKSVFLETQDKKQNGSWVHRNYITK